MYWITTDPAIVIVILIATGAIDIDMLMVPTVGATDRLSGKFHKHSLSFHLWQMNGLANQVSSIDYRPLIFYSQHT